MGTVEALVPRFKLIDAKLKPVALVAELANSLLREYSLGDILRSHSELGNSPQSHNRAKSSNICT